jgi:hypothetical protein
MRKNRTPAIAAALLTAGLVVAAAPAGASRPAAAQKGACKYLTTREAGTILGTRSGGGKSTSISESESCTWKAKKKGTGGLKGQPLQLEVSVATGSEAVADFQEEKAEDPTETEAVTGLGEDAFVKDLDLNVLIGDRVMTVELHNYRYPEPLTQDEIKQKEQDAATIALGRLSSL